MFIPQDHFIKINQINTCYWAEGEGEPLLLVHGMGGSAAGWLPCLEALSAHYRVYAPDLVGHGRTGGLESALDSASDLAKFIHDFMLELKIDSAFVMGHSMGGVITLRLAIDFPDSIRKLVLVDTSGLGREIGTILRLLSTPILGELLSILTYTPDVDKFGAGVRKASKNPTSISDELIGALFQIEQKPDQYKTTLKFLRKGVNWLGQKESFRGPIVHALSSITCPVLVIWGQQDDLVPVKHGEFAARTLPKARLEVINHCGHIPMFDQPDIFNQLALDFLGE